MTQKIIGNCHLINIYEKQPIEKDTIIRISGEFRSIGLKNVEEEKEKSKTPSEKEKIKEIPINSRLYFGLHCYTDTNRLIYRTIISRVNEPIKVLIYDEKNKSLKLESIPSSWNDPQKKPVHLCYIGFYFDGNINKLPDELVGDGGGGYDKIINREIFLKKELSENIKNKIKEGKTIVMNHCAGGTYDYSAASYAEVPREWTTYKAEYKGISNMGECENGKFWPFSKYVNPFILANYQQSNEAALEIRNIKMEVIRNAKL